MVGSNLKVATGFYTIWDVIAKLDEEELEWLEKQEKIKPRTESLNSVEEAAYAFKYALETGGREHLITKELSEQLKNIFRFKERRLGGNGYHMGKALHELGVTPLVSYPCRPKSIMVASPNFKVALKNGFTAPKQAIRNGDPEYEHLIFEFEESKERGIRISGRQIFSYDQMSFEGKFDEDFFTYGFNKEYTDVLIFAYAHLLLPKYKSRTDIVVDHLSTYKRPKVHLEFGDGSDESIFYAIKKFSDSQCSESWGFNEKECRKYINARSEDLDDLKNAALETVKKYGLERICVHTPKFAFSISKYSVEKESKALQAGILAAAALTMGNLHQNLSKAAKLPKSEIESRIEKLSGGYNFCLTPTRVNMKPRILTGLGDTFAAVQAATVLGW